VLDAIRVQNSILSEVAFFDVIPSNDIAQFSGTWSNYPYLPSGIVLASSMYDGMFIVKPTIINTSESSWDLCGETELVFEIDINAELAFPLTVGLDGLGAATATAQVINGQGTTVVTISGVSELYPGTYSPNLLLISNFGEQYEVPLEVAVCNSSNVSQLLPTELSVFPNPTQNTVQVSLAHPVEQIELLDAFGKRVMSFSTNNQLSFSLDVSSLSAGSYALKAGEEVVRVVVAR
jgi:hypothetical protein